MAAKTKEEYLRELVECPVEHPFYCPYWDYRYQKCAMVAKEEVDPSEICGLYRKKENEYGG